MQQQRHIRQRRRARVGHVGQSRRQRIRDHDARCIRGSEIRHAQRVADHGLTRHDGVGILRLGDQEVGIGTDRVGRLRRVVRCVDVRLLAGHGRHIGEHPRRGHAHDHVDRDLMTLAHGQASHFRHDLAVVDHVHPLERHGVQAAHLRRRERTVEDHGLVDVADEVLAESRVPANRDVVVRSLRADGRRKELLPVLVDVNALAGNEDRRHVLPLVQVDAQPRVNLGRTREHPPCAADVEQRPVETAVVRAHHVPLGGACRRGIGPGRHGDRHRPRLVDVQVGRRVVVAPIEHDGCSEVPGHGLVGGPIERVERSRVSLP